MASSSNPKKRSKWTLIKRASSKENNETNYLERCFISNQENIDDYYRLYSRKVIISPKVLSMEWLKEEKLDEIKDILRFQKLERFLKMFGNPYSGLVKVFLTNMWYNEDTIYSQVKRMDIAINEEVWLAVIGLWNDGVVVSRGNTTEVDNFNKV